MRFINILLKPFDAQLSRKTSLNKERYYYEGTIKRLFDFYLDFSSKNPPVFNNDIYCIVFSKDRAMQLHALLSSYFYYTKNYAPIIVLFTYTNDQHKEAYQILQKEFEALPVSFVIEDNFKIQLKEIIQKIKADRIFFMTDDGIFLNEYDLSGCLSFDPLKYIFSLRLGADFDFCYSYNRKQTVPGFLTEERNGKKYNSWIWQHMKDSPDWIYPLSVDATIFYKREIEIILQNISFKSPNSLESQLQLYNDLFIHRKGVCFQEAKYVNVPCNIVQKEYDNIFTGTFSVTELAERFLGGERIDWKLLHNYKPRDAQTVKFCFTKIPQFSE